MKFLAGVAGVCRLVYRGKHEASGTPIPAKSLMQDIFAEHPTALILDEFQTWFDGLHDDPGDSGLKRRQWAFCFVQILSELAKERPDLLMLIVSVRDSTTEGYRQIHRIGPVVVDFKGETAKEDRKSPWPRRPRHRCTMRPSSRIA